MRSWKGELAAIVCASLTTTATAQVQFVDVTKQTGTDGKTYGRGVAFADLDGDGLLDVVAANAGMNIGVFHQLADHTFEDAYAKWGFANDTRAHWGVIAADFDNDGDVDLYILDGGFTAKQPNQLLRNDLATSGVFTDVSSSSGDATISKSTFGGTALDFDRDGLLDVFMSNLGGQGCTLLRNVGGMKFRNVSSGSKIAETGGNYRHCSAGDVDNDGWIDLAVGNYSGNNLVYRNNGDGTFSDVASSCGLATPYKNFGLVLEDFDNDGWMDAYVPKYQTNPTGPSELYLNNGDGTFRDVTSGSGMTGQTDMGHNTNDVDGDGYPDVFIGCGNPSFKDYAKLFLITPDGHGGLVATDASVSSGLNSNGPARAHGSGFGDYDGDGDVDLFENNGGPEGDPNMLEPTWFWQNQGSAHHWLEVDFRGVISNRSAIGARAHVVTSAGRAVHRFRSAGKGFGNTDSPTSNFGIGDDKTIDELFVSWPSGVTQRVLSPAVDQKTSLVETGMLYTGDPRPGAQLTLQTCGPAQHVLDLFVSTETAWTPLPPLGVLELDLPLTMLLDAALDDTGRLDVVLDVPADPSLIGTTFHLQACVHAPSVPDHGVLTNRVDVAIH
jgi:hypothetical protein